VWNQTCSTLGRTGKWSNFKQTAAHRRNCGVSIHVLPHAFVGAEFEGETVHSDATRD
jgi:hypothetical protein